MAGVAGALPPAKVDDCATATRKTTVDAILSRGMVGQEKMLE